LKPDASIVGASGAKRSRCGAGELKIIAAIVLASPDANGPEDRLRLASARASVF